MKFKMGDVVKLKGSKRKMVVCEDHEDDNLVFCMWETKDGQATRVFETITLKKIKKEKNA